MAKKLSKDQLDELIESLKHVKDPRVQGRSKHLLIDVIAIAVIGTLCGAEGPEEIFSFANAKHKVLKKWLELPHGIPSSDTISRVLSIINPAHLEKAILDWLNDAIEETKSIGIDGKYTKGTERTFNRGKKPLLMVSAYSHELGLSLFETEGTNGSEIAGAEACIEALDLKGVLVDVDAGIGSRAIAQKIIKKGGDYLLPLKANSRTYRDEVDEIFKVKMKTAKVATTEDDGHGRGERRSSFVLPAKYVSDKFLAQWPEAKTIYAIVRERTSPDLRYVIQETGKDGKQTYRLNDGDMRFSEEVVYYVSSRQLSAKAALEETRKHWGIENKLHWVLDVAFKEDDCRVRSKKLARTLSFIRKVALNLIRSSNTKGSVRGRMKKAAWNDDFLCELLFKRAF